MFYYVGMKGFEPLTPRILNEYSDQTELHPVELLTYKNTISNNYYFVKLFKISI